VGGELGIDFEKWIISARLTGFWNELEDTIAFVTVSPFPSLSFQRRNIGATQSRGVEFETQLDITSELSIMPSYVFTDATIRDFPSDPTRVGNRVPNIPKHQLNFTIRYDNPRIITLSFRGRYLSDRFANDRNTQELGSFFVLDVSASRRLGEHWELFIVGENIANETYLASQTGQVATLGAPAQVWGGVRFDY
jgi:iron complex outermembrane receptor protein